MASYGGLQGILTGLAKSTDHPSRILYEFQSGLWFLGLKMYVVC